MDHQTVKLLNQLNHLFYQTVGRSFDKTRERPWPGWKALLPFIDTSKTSPLRVLDLGCGNGRFGRFLAKRLPIHYTGLDSSAFLLEEAAFDLTDANIPHTLMQADLVEMALSGSGEALSGKYDLVTLFGVLHHIPGFVYRRELLHMAYRWLAPGGLLAATVWTFYEQERFQEHLIRWEDAPAPYRDLSLEPHDYLMDWRRDTPALRYCHYMDRDEETRLIDGLPLHARYEEDGGNRYFLFKRPPSDNPPHPDTTA